MATYTSAEIESINNYPVVAYFNNIFLGVFETGDHTITVTPSYQKVTSSMSGTGAIRQLFTGIEETSATFTLLSIHKNVLKAIYEDIFFQSTNATSASFPTAGRLEGRSLPRGQDTNSLVIYPIWTDTSTGTEYSDTTANPLAFTIPKATTGGVWEWVLNSTTHNPYEVKFEGMADPANNMRTFVFGSGISTSGTIS
jgi:hypothetical protein